MILRHAPAATEPSCDLCGRVSHLFWYDQDRRSICALCLGARIDEGTTRYYYHRLGAHLEGLGCPWCMR